MHRWIHEFVMKYKICPYAKGSSYSIHVWTHQELQPVNGGQGHGGGEDDEGGKEESILDFCHHHLPWTVSTPPSPTTMSTSTPTTPTSNTTSVVHRPNVFLCFPNVPEFQDYLSFFGFYQALIHVLPHVGGDNDGASASTSTGAMYGHQAEETEHNGNNNNNNNNHGDENNQLVWQSFVFHPNYVDMGTDQPNWRFRAPFPSLHFIPLADLQQQRQKQPKTSPLRGSRETTTITAATTMSKAIFQRNVITLQQSDVVATLQKILQDAREGERKIG